MSHFLEGCIMKVTPRKIVLAVTAASSILLLAGCNVGADASKGMGDAPVNQTQNHKPAYVINFSDKYPNIEFKCNGTVGIYTNTRSSGFFQVVKDDPNCPAGVPAS
jgi:hypothetical protein